jgi:hypothetical protein
MQPNWNILLCGELILCLRLKAAAQKTVEILELCEILAKMWGDHLG